MVDSGDGDHTADRNRETDTTLHLSREFESQLAALDGEVSPEVQEAIAALPSGSALLVVRRGPNTGARFLLNSDLTTAGRHPDADIFLDDVTVSRRHSQFVRHGNSLRDQGSRVAQRHVLRRCPRRLGAAFRRRGSADRQVPPDLLCLPPRPRKAPGQVVARSSAQARLPGTPPLLSIGQVLARLTAEFPDLTPSKLRFLEERQLISPARTESGYRKFSPADLERLRFVLTMQREHYLPLKVIRGYLADLDAGRQPDLPGTAAIGAPSMLTAERRLRREELIREAGASPQLLGDADQRVVDRRSGVLRRGIAVRAPLARGASAQRDRAEAPARVPGLRRTGTRPHRERVDPGRPAKRFVEQGESERTRA